MPKKTKKTGGMRALKNPAMKASAKAVQALAKEYRDAGKKWSFKALKTMRYKQLYKQFMK